MNPNYSLPLVSIVMPAYNHGKFVQQAIESVANQTYRNIEIFVIDDGSKDDTIEIIESLQKQHNFYFEKQANQGLSATMNKLFSMCNGKYIAGCASDDFFALDKIEKQVAFMEKNTDVGACFGDALVVNQHNELIPEMQDKTAQYKEYLFADIIMRDYNLIPLTVMFRKSVLDKIGYYDKNYVLEDFYMWMKLTYNNFKIVKINELLGSYRVHGSNMHQNTFLMYTGNIKILEQYKDHELYSQAVNKIYKHYLPYLAVFHKSEALKIYRKSFQLNVAGIISLFLLTIPKPVFILIAKPIIKIFFRQYLYLLGKY